MSYTSFEGSTSTTEWVRSTKVLIVGIFSEMHIFPIVKFSQNHLLKNSKNLGFQNDIASTSGNIFPNGQKYVQAQE